MTPVISPWIFYLMSVANAVKVIAFAVGGIVGLAWVIMAPLRVWKVTFGSFAKKAV